MTDVSIDEIKVGLQDRVHAVVRELFPEAKIKGRTAHVSSSGKSRDGGSLVIWLGGSRDPGNWKDYASVEKGDVIDLVAYGLGGRGHPMGTADRARAIAWARQFLGLDGRSDAERRAARQAAEKRRIEAEQKHAASLARKQRWAFDIFTHARPGLADTVAAAYLAARGIHWRSLVNIEPDVRFSPREEWWLGAVRNEEGRKVRPGPTFPAIVNGMRNARGSVVAVHITFLAPDGSGKADVPGKSKLIFPDSAGAVMRVARGHSGLDAETASERGVDDTLVITEGLEDALSLSLVRPDLRIWACGGLANIRNVAIPPCAKQVIVAGDNDWIAGNATATVALESAVAHLRATFKVPVSTVFSPAGKDFNDCLRAEITGDAA